MALVNWVTLLTQMTFGLGLGGGPSDGAADGSAGVRRSSRISNWGTNAFHGLFMVVSDGDGRRLSSGAQFEEGGDPLGSPK
jgi:hypothetical protein